MSIQDKIKKLAQLKTDLYKKDFLLTWEKSKDDLKAILEVAEILKEMGIEAELYTCENLGYPEEKIVKGTPKDPPIPATILYGLLVVQKFK